MEYSYFENAKDETKRFYLLKTTYTGITHNSHFEYLEYYSNIVLCNARANEIIKDVFKENYKVLFRSNNKYTTIIIGREEPENNLKFEISEIVVDNK